MTQEYLYINNSNKKIGFNRFVEYTIKDNLEFNHIESIDCFKITDKDEKEYFLAGKKDFKGTFNPIPYTVGNVQLLNFTIDKEHYNESVNLSINVFDIKKNKLEELQLSFEYNSFYHSGPFRYKPTNLIVFIISILNDFLDSKRDLNDFDFENFLKKIIRVADLYDIINNLDIEFHSVSSGRRSWCESIIKRLPHNIYLLDILKTTFEKNSSFNFCKERRISSISNDTITLIFDYDSDMPTYSNENVKIELKDIDLKIRDILKIELAKIYSPLEHLLTIISN